MIKDSLKAIDKLDNTICLNHEGKPFRFAIDNVEHIDCNNLYEAVDCIELITKDLKEYSKLKKIIPCPVSVLLKALTNGIYGYETSVANDTFNNLIITKMRIPKLKLDYLTHTKLVFEQDKHYVKRIYRLEDYQITWGLTKTDFKPMSEKERYEALGKNTLLEDVSYEKWKGK